MKILSITSHISSKVKPCFQRNKTGFGYMVHDIITALAAKGNECDVLVSWYRFDDFELDGANYIGCSFGKIIRHLFQCISLKFFATILRKYPVSKRATAKLFYCWLLTGYYRSVIEKGNYDIVHIHGCGLNEDLWVRLCQQLGQKYVVTLHGLNSFNDTVSIEASRKQYERDFLHEVVQGKHHITVIATGIKNRILKAENLSESNYIDVVCNSFHFEDCENSTIDVRAIYQIPIGAKVLLYVGNIGRNKNQQQLVEAFPLLEESLRENTYILFVGRPSEELDLQKLIDESPFAHHLIYVGGVDKTLMANYYKAADATVLLSCSEGFGLSLVEGMHFGLPCMMFMDMDAYVDIYAPRAVVGIPSRSNEVVAKAMEVMMNNIWDREEIMTISNRFSADVMGNNYMRIFDNAINKK